MTTTVAVISDIHANLPALQAVWQHAAGRGASEIWHAGDHVGYSAFPNQTIQWLQEHKAVSVLGDYDLRMLQVQEKRSEWQRKRHPTKLQALLWARRQLTAASMTYLQELPRTVELCRAGLTFILNHGSPAAIDEGLAPSTSNKRLRKLASMVEANAILSGDSHRPFRKEVEGVTFFNPGSVGRPDDGDPRASYGLLYLDANGFRTELHRVEYDVEQAVKAIRQAALPEDFAQMLIQGRSFDDIIWR